MFSYSKYKFLFMFVGLFCVIAIFKYQYETDNGNATKLNLKQEKNFENITKVVPVPNALNADLATIKSSITSTIKTTANTSGNKTKIIVSKKADPFICYKNFKSWNLIVNNVSAVEIKPGRTIFFLETSCRSNDLNQITLNPRQGCAIESAAISHPNLDVVLLVLSSNALGSPMHPILNVLTVHYKNIRILHVNIDEYFKGTPVENLHTSGRMLESSYPMIHISDVLRYITLWKFGGIYLDLDVLITKNLEELGPNFTGLENSGTIAAGLMGFDDKGLGHYWVESILNKINSTYKPNAWCYNALEVLKIQLEKVCNTTKISQMTQKNCRGFNLLPKLAFYEISWSGNNWKYFFESNYTDYVMKIMSTPGVKAAHLWNKLSHAAVPEENSAYRILAARYCPLVYNITKNDF